jgi:hypothetical protein
VHPYLNGRVGERCTRPTTSGSGRSAAPPSRPAAMPPPPPPISAEKAVGTISAERR